MTFSKTKIKKSARITYNVFFNLFLLFFVIGLILFSFVGGVGAGYFASLVKDEEIRSYESMKKDIYDYEETTDLYFANGEYLGKLRSDLYREEITIDQVSEHLINAIIATEDEYFHEHNGIVPKAILRALYQEFTNAAVQTGGSTLTQQLIKNQILTNEVSFERKAKEILLALRLERFFEKEEILEAYLNVATFGRNSSGRNIAGVEAAAQGIFGVPASELNLPQAAYIAGLPQSPSRYTPFTQKGELKENIEPGLDRMKTVLSRMLSVGYITEQEYKEALAYDIKANLIPPQENPAENYPWLSTEIELRAIEILAGILAENDGYTKEDLQQNKDLYSQYKIIADRDIRRNGYKIYSTIDKEIYDKMQEIKDSFEFYGNDKPETITNPETGEKEQIMEPVEVGAMLIENKTGRIISFIGGRDHDREQLNHATRALRSNGSTMKPLLVYGPAIQEGVASPGTMIADIETAIPVGNSTWSPKNYDGRSHGLVSARYALAKSYNIPTARLYASIIDRNPTVYLEKMGFTSLTEGDRSHLSMALGAMDVGVTVEENVNAYATFANYGQFIDAYLIEKIETKDGEVIYEHQPEPVEVFTPQSAFLTLDMLREVIRSGTGAGLPSRLKFKSDWAGKTGTSQDYKDAWFVASNPNITFGVWIGYDTPKSLERSYRGYSYSQRNQMLWAQLMNATYDIRPELVAPADQFEMPGGIVKRSYCAMSGLLPSDLCKEAGLIRTDLFDVNNVPTEVDNTLVRGSYVTINGKNYRALPETPKEFVKEGIMINNEFLKRHHLQNVSDVAKLIPVQDSWKNLLILEENQISDNGKAPDPIRNVRLSNNTIVWEKSAEADIVGYRIYRKQGDGGQRVGTLSSAAESLSYTLQNGGSYYVTAVDIVGKESQPSESISYGSSSSGEEEPANNEKELEEEGIAPVSNDNEKENGKKEDKEKKENKQNKNGKENGNQKDNDKKHPNHKDEQDD